MTWTYTFFIITMIVLILILILTITIVMIIINNNNSIIYIHIYVYMQMTLLYEYMYVYRCIDYINIYINIYISTHLMGLSDNRVQVPPKIVVLSRSSALSSWASWLAPGSTSPCHGSCRAWRTAPGNSHGKGGFHGRSHGKLGDSGGISHDNWGFLVDIFRAGGFHRNSHENWRFSGSHDHFVGIVTFIGIKLTQMAVQLPSEMVI